MSNDQGLRALWGNANRQSYKLAADKKPDEATRVLDAAYRAIATTYAGLSINKSDPFAFGRMLNSLRRGLEKPLDEDRDGNQTGVIQWIEQREPAEKAWLAARRGEKASRAVAPADNEYDSADYYNYASAA